MADLGSAIDTLVAKGRAEVPDFDDKTQFVTTMAGSNFDALREAVAELPDGHRVIAALADDPDQAAALLRLPPRKMAMALGRLAGSAPEPRRASAATPPPLVANLHDENLDMRKWASTFDKMHQDRREAAAAPPQNQNIYDPKISGADLDKGLDRVIANLRTRRRAK